MYYCCDLSVKPMPVSNASSIDLCNYNATSYIIAYMHTVR